MKEYITRIIDNYLLEWKDDSTHKPLLLRGARQVGKSSAARHLGKQFKYFAEINFERQKEAKTFFMGDLDVKLIASKIAINFIIVWMVGITFLQALLLLCVAAIGRVSALDCSVTKRMVI
jgi:hypothetical protein